MIATRSPAATRVTPGPVATTSPANSCPRICGFCAPVSGCGSTGRDDRPRDVLVQVGAADAAARDPHHDLAGGRARAARRRPRCAGRGRRGSGARSDSPHGTIRSARRRAKRSVNEDSVSRTPRKPSRRLLPMSVNVSTVRPRSASVCHHEASVSTSRSRRPWLARCPARRRRRRPSAPRAARARRRTAAGSTPSAAASRGHSRRQRKTSPLTMLSAWFAAAGVVAAHTRWSASRLASVTSVIASHCSCEPGKWKRLPGLAADRAVDRQRHAHVHRVAERPADQRVRPVHRPGEPVALGRREQDVLLRVVEVLVRQARLLLGERRVGLGLRVGLERPEVVLQAGDQGDVPHRALGADRVEQVLRACGR